MVSGNPRRPTSGAGRTGIVAMRMRWSYCLGGLGVAALSLLAGLEVEMATARPTTVSTTIDRTLKGDRLDPATRPDLRPEEMRPNIRPSIRPSTAPAGRLPDGCESSVSTIRNSPVIGRCLAATPAGKPALG